MKPRSRSFRALLALLTASAALAAIDGCTIINGLTLDGPDAAIDAKPAAEGGADADPCMHARPPVRPLGADTPDNQTITVVVNKFVLDARESGGTIGFDLDGTCSCLLDAPETCRRPTASGTAHCDTPGGRDNAAGTLFGTFKTLPGDSDFQARVNDSIAAGKNTLLLRVTGYNGKADDPEVTLSVFASLGLFVGTTNNHATPQFIESEKWSLDSRQFTDLSSDIPKAFARGWVSGGKLVAMLDTTIDLSDSLTITLKGGIVQADIDTTGTQPTITGGVIAGRWPVTDLLRVVGRLHTQDGGGRLCDNSTAASFVKTQVCGEVDIRADLTTPVTTEICDAVSAALGFEARPATLGDRRMGTPDDPCPNEVPDDCAKDSGP
jgi:hypothetical protein